MRRRRAAIALAVALGMLGGPGAAVAEGPPNDDRASAQDVTLPAKVHGTTVGSTEEAVEPRSDCGATKGSVWYRFTAPRDGRVIVNLHALGDLDAIVDVYLRERSQVSDLGCDTTDKTGEGGVTVDIRKGQSYLVRVAERSNSVAGDFDLELLVGQPLAEPPGRPLPARGAYGTVDRLLNPSDAWSVRLRAGRTYRFNSVGADDTCMFVGLYGPNASELEEPVRSRGCGGYIVFTPGPGEAGRYTLLVQADRSERGTQRYHLQAGVARRDDVAPGVFIRNYAKVRGRLNGARLDVVDLYRFDVVRRSNLDLALSGDDGFNMQLLDDRGRGVDFSESGITRPIRRGRYFVAVRAQAGASGAYVLRRISRAITRTATRFNGRRRARSAPGQTVRLGVFVSPAVRGPVRIEVSRFDPLEGWQFYREYRRQAIAGRVSVAFRPPTVGRWRARASYGGTREASPSASGFASLLVAGRLRQ